MIKYLNRLKGRKGFSLVELMVVVAIMAVLMAALLVNMIGGNTDKILAANANAEVFFPACQLAFTRANLTERELVEYASGETKYIEYKNGLNQIPDGKYLFVEVKFNQRGIEGLHIDFTFNGLMSHSDTDPMNDLEKYLATNIDEYLAESYDGYFYAVVDNDFKVMFTHYCDYRLPTYSGDLTKFRDDMMISDGKVKGNSAIIGSCSDVYTIPTTGEYVFALPTSTDADYGKYLA